MHALHHIIPTIITINNARNLADQQARQHRFRPVAGTCRHTHPCDTLLSFPCTAKIRCCKCPCCPPSGVQLARPCPSLAPARSSWKWPRLLTSPRKPTPTENMTGTTRLSCTLMEWNCCSSSCGLPTHRGRLHQGLLYMTAKRAASAYYCLVMCDYPCVCVW